MKVSIFDFDGTLICKDTLPFMLKCWYRLGYSKIKFSIAILRSIFPYIIYKSKLFTIDRMAFKILATRIFVKILDGMTQKQIDDYMQKCTDMITDEYFPPVLDALKRDQKNGCTTILLSGAFDPFIQAIAKSLNFDKAYATPFIYKKDGTIDTNAELSYIVSNQKKQKVLQYLEGVDVDWDDSFCYADSFTDLGVLNLVGNPCAVNPDSDLLQYATDRNWKIL